MNTISVCEICLETSGDVLFKNKMTCNDFLMITIIVY
jgi:hypothetical protein